LPITETISAGLNESIARKARGRCHGNYGDGHAAERIAKVIGGLKDPKALLRKKFYRYGVADIYLNKPNARMPWERGVRT
jgi:hypothetical protein